MSDAWQAFNTEYLQSHGRLIEFLKAYTIHLQSGHVLFYYDVLKTWDWYDSRNRNGLGRFDTLDEAIIHINKYYEDN